MAVQGKQHCPLEAGIYATLQARGKTVQTCVCKLPVFCILMNSWLPWGVHGSAMRASPTITLAVPLSLLFAACRFGQCRQMLMPSCMPGVTRHLP